MDDGWKRLGRRAALVLCEQLTLLALAALGGSSCAEAHQSYECGLWSGRSVVCAADQVCVFLDDRTPPFEEICATGTGCVGAEAHCPAGYSLFACGEQEMPVVGMLNAARNAVADGGATVPATVVSCNSP